MNILRSTLGLLALSLTMAARSSLAALTIDVGDVQLLPDRAGQKVDLFVSGGDPVEGLNLFVQVADGGPAAGGVQPGPRLTAVDLLHGTLFDGNNLGQFELATPSPQLAAFATLTAAGTVTASGRFATLTFDTTGLGAGSWPLLLSGTLAGTTDFAGIEATITGGTLTTVIPEPALAAPAVLCLSIPLRRRRRPVRHAPPRR